MVDLRRDAPLALPVARPLHPPRLRIDHLGMVIDRSIRLELEAAVVEDLGRRTYRPTILLGGEEIWRSTVETDSAELALRAAYDALIKAIGDLLRAQEEKRDHPHRRRTDAES
jgi:hypothetical protein